jgi:type IX secretion system PorP/SprF family membrane protein
MKPIIGAGLILKGEKYLLGLSVPRLVNSSFDLGGQKFKMYQQHYYLMGSYLFYMSEHVVLKPSVLLKAVSGTPLSTDLNFNIILNRNYTAGVFTRNFNTYGALLQLAFLEKYRLAYLAELPTNQSVGAHFVSHEVMISIRTAVFKFHRLTQSNF